MTIPPCARCRQPGILTTISGAATWPKTYDWSNSFVVPEFPERCELAGTPDVCTSGACKSPEDAASKWNGAQTEATRD